MPKKEITILKIFLSDDPCASSRCISCIYVFFTLFFPFSKRDIKVTSPNNGIIGFISKTFRAHLAGEGMDLFIFGHSL
jgi:hypothetical protein